MAAEKVTIKVTNKSIAQVVLPEALVAGSTEATRTVTSSDFDLDATYTEDSTPDVEEFLSVAITIGGAATTIDLTAADVVGGTAEDLTGLKLWHIEVETPAANVGSVTIGPNATNGYALFGGTNEIDVPPGSKVGFTTVGSGLPTVAAGAKNIDIDGTAADVANVKMAFETP